MKLPNHYPTESAPSRRPLRVMFLQSTLVHGGAETLLVELLRRMDRARFAPELCLLKTLGPLGAPLVGELPVFFGLLRHKYDLGVLPRLVRLLRRREIDAVVTVGAGDKMFWGRLAARCGRVPVVISALHSTGWPDGVSRLNRILTPLTDAFVAVARTHARYLATQEGFGAHRVRTIPNGVDTDRYRPRPADEQLRRRIGLPVDAPVAGIVARLGPEKNHAMFLRVAALTRRQVPDAHFLVIGDGPERGPLRRLAAELGLDGCVHFLGMRDDVPDLLALLDVFLLTSHTEANPVSVLEALASGKAVIATRVGSVHESVRDGEVGYLVDPDIAEDMAMRLVQLFERPSLARELGAEGREQVVRNWSLERMVEGYEELIEELYTAKQGGAPSLPREPSALLCSESTVIGGGPS